MQIGSITLEAKKFIWLLGSGILFNAQAGDWKESVKETGKWTLIEENQSK